jgi:hypothetical protein
MKRRHHGFMRQIGSGTDALNRVPRLQAQKPADIASRLSPKTIHEAHLSASIQGLLRSTDERIRYEVTRVWDPKSTMGKPRDLVLLIVDGTSPLAPREIKQAGAKGVGLNVAIREPFAEILKLDPRYVDLVRCLSVPAACGHLEFVASTADGFLIRCTQCMLGIQPDGSSGTPTEVVEGDGSPA